MILQRPSLFHIKSFHKLTSKKEKETEKKARKNSHKNFGFWIKKEIHVKYMLAESIL